MLATYKAPNTLSVPVIVIFGEVDQSRMTSRHHESGPTHVTVMWVIWINCLYLERKSGKSDHTEGGLNAVKKLLWCGSILLRDAKSRAFAFLFFDKNLGQVVNHGHQRLGKSGRALITGQAGQQHVLRDRRLLS